MLLFSVVILLFHCDKTELDVIAFSICDKTELDIIAFSYFVTSL